MCKKKPHIYNSCPTGEEEAHTAAARACGLRWIFYQAALLSFFSALLFCRPWYSRGNLAQSNFTSLRKLLEGSTGYFLHMWDIHWFQLFLSFLFQLLLCKLSITFMKGSRVGVTKRHCFFVIFDSWIKWGYYCFPFGGVIIVKLFLFCNSSGMYLLWLVQWPQYSVIMIDTRCGADQCLQLLLKNESSRCGGGDTVAFTLAYTITTWCLFIRPFGDH